MSPEDLRQILEFIQAFSGVDDMMTIHQDAELVDVPSNDKWAKRRFTGKTRITIQFTTREAVHA